MHPTVGRIVHYQPRPLGGEVHPPWAAIITFVNPNSSVNLASFTPDGSLRTQRNVEESKFYVPAPGKWNWPPLAGGPVAS